MLYYCTQEIFGEGKFWQTVQVKTIGEEKFGEKLVSAYDKYIFSVSVNTGGENCGE